jgi:hypothetical protein
MLLPRYSLRWFFYIIVVVALLGLIVGEGLQGARWAMAIALGVASLAVTWSVLVLFYAIVSGYAAIALGKDDRKGRDAYYPAPALARPAASNQAP